MGSATVSNVCSTGKPSTIDPMLLSGINHVAVVTQDTDRFHEFYGSVFGATVFADEPTNADEGEPPGRLSFVTIGPHTQFNVFEIPVPPPDHTPMFGRGPIDHIG